MRVLDLFSGIGGFSLGLERAGMTTVAFCEIEPFCRRVLAKHWPEVPIYDDVRTLTATRLAADGIGVDVICGGFPCQDISLAGNGAGLAGERSGLWREYARLVSELRPRFVIVENVSALLGRGIGDVLGDLASLGYDAEWHCIRAAFVGLPHARDRVWIVAYADCAGPQRITHTRSFGESWTHAAEQLEGLLAMEGRLAVPAGSSGGVTDGVPDRMERLHALGNAVVPQIPELIGRAILSSRSRSVTPK
jgi:DNA (cytosine-5)-methyltransferase 1